MQFLIDAVARALSLTETKWAPRAASVTEFIEDPLRGLVTIVGVGLFLYFLDPGYGAPQFYRHLPSDHLKERLDTLGHGGAVDSLSIYFLASDELMAEPIKDRALLYGAFYRIGFQLSLYAGLAAGAIGLLTALAEPRVGELAPSKLAVTLSILLLGLSMWPLLREIAYNGSSKKLPRLLRCLIAVLGLVTIVGAWLVTASRWSGGFMRWTVGVTAALLAAWAALRLLGPVRPRLAQLRSQRRAKPDTPFSNAEDAVHNLILVGSVCGPVLALSHSVPAAPIWIAVALAAITLTMDIFRKHERQLHGIYRNQNAWIDANLEAIVAKYVEPISKMRSSSDGTTGRS